MSDIEADGCPVWAPFVGFTGVMFALVFASESGPPAGLHRPRRVLKLYFCHAHHGCTGAFRAFPAWYCNEKATSWVPCDYMARGGVKRFRRWPFL